MKFFHQLSFSPAGTMGRSRIQSGQISTIPNFFPFRLFSPIFFNIISEFAFCSPVSALDAHLPPFSEMGKESQSQSYVSWIFDWDFWFLQIKMDILWENIYQTIRSPFFPPYVW